MKPQLPNSICPSGGFTLIEMIVTVAIIGILAMIATPSLRDAMLNARMVGMANDTMADLNIARSEAVKRNSTVALCPSADGLSCGAATTWAQGWIVFNDLDLSGTRAAAEELIKVSPALANTNPNALTVTRANVAVASVSYGPSGVVAGGQTIFTFCDIRAGATPPLNSARQVTINVTGRPSVTKTTCAAP